MTRRRHPRQLEMLAITTAPAEQPKWGGRREGAGRKKSPGGPRHVPHRARERHAKSRPVHITMRARRGLPSFRSQLVHQMMLGVLAHQRDPRRRRYASDFRVVHFSIQSNHLHVIVEAKDRRVLRSGASGLVIAFAKRLARLLGRTTGKVWPARYHSRELGSPREVRNALSYLLNNYKKHGTTTHGDGIVDRYSSASHFEHWHVPPRVAVPLDDDEQPPPRGPRWRPPQPETWLLARGFRDHHGPLSTNAVPA